MKHSINISWTIVAITIFFAGNANALGIYYRPGTKSFSFYRTPSAKWHRFIFSTSLHSVAKQSLSIATGLPLNFSSANKQNTLFKIARSKDANEIMYDINLDKNGELNQSTPVDVYWIKHSNGGKRESLNSIQKKYAYGLKFLSVKKQQVIFEFVSYNKRAFILKKNSEGQYRVFVISLAKQVELRKIFIQVDGGSFWFPKISRVELHGKDSATGLQTVETIIP